MTIRKMTEKESNMLQEIMNLRKNNRDLETQNKFVLEYCYEHINFMWASTVAGLIIGCDFKDAKQEIEKLHPKFVNTL
jgi:hypothetical protein